MDLCSRHGNYACVAGVSEILPAAAKVMTYVTAPIMAAHGTLIIGDIFRHTNVTKQG